MENAPHLLPIAPVPTGNAAARPPENAIHFSPILAELARLEKTEAFLTKGAPEAVFPRCKFYELEGETFPLEPILVGDLMQQYQQLSADGFRVLAVAHKHLDTQPLITKEDECDLILKGYVAFLDPPSRSFAT